MKLQHRVIFILVVAFILVVSYKILEPEIKGLKKRDNIVSQTRTVSQKEQPHDGGHVKPQGHHYLGNLTFDEAVNFLLKKYDFDWDMKLSVSPWTRAASWVTHKYIHPEHTPEMGAILKAMNQRKIVAADVGYRGTQLKMSLILAGGQKVAFKPKWYTRDHIIVGKPYDGADRHNGEIASFHLNRMLGLRKSPLVVGRVIDLEKDIKPVSEERLLKTFFTKENNTCFWGKCYYCKGEHTGVCGEGTKLEGAVVLWLPSHFRYKLWRHPWGRTYKEGKLANWETDVDYCDYIQHIPPYDAGPRLLDILDASVFDYLIGNADRHHYETFRDYEDSMLVMFDSAKSFGNPFMDEESILAPIYQCCRLRSQTWNTLQQYRDGLLSQVLRQILKKDPISPILTEYYYEALDRRLGHIFETIDKCVQKLGPESVFVHEQTDNQPFQR